MLFLFHFAYAQRKAKGRRAFAASLLSVRLDTSTATERCQQNGEKLPHEKTNDVRRKNKRKNEESETQKTTAREKSRACNKSSSTTKLDATTTELITKPAAIKATDEKEKIVMIRIVPNVKLRGAALLRRPARTTGYAFAACKSPKEHEHRAS